MPPLRQILVELFILVAVVLVIAFLGPFGTYALGQLEARILYWGQLIFGGYVIIRPAMRLAPALAQQLGFPLAVVWAGLASLAALPLTLLVWFVNGAHRLPSGAEFLRLLPHVLAITVLMSGLFWLLRRRPETPAAAAPPPISRSPGTPRLLDRLPLGRRGRIRALEMEDHYVRVHTDLGSDLVLMRMGDAIAELDGLEGLRVHRGWWVAREAVTEARWDGRNLRLALEGGLLAPVARSRVAEVRAAGWVASQPAGS
ncbi:MAG: LytTR family DNA-binding domain-containing protein [Thermaurantiacus sp.]